MTRREKKKEEKILRVFLASEGFFLFPLEGSVT
jgi:hypothetical protein